MPNPEQAVDLGERLGVFAPTPRYMFVGYVLNSAMIVAGIAIVAGALYAAYSADWMLPVYTEKGWSWFTVDISFLPAILLWVASPLVCEYLRDVRSRRMKIYEKGFRYNDANTGASVLWTDVALVREITSWNRHPLLKRLISSLVPATASQTIFTITLKSGKVYAFASDAVGSMDALGQTLRKERMRLGLRWEFVDEVSDGY